MTASVRQPVLLGLFTGTAVGVGYLLAGVPNVELMTLVIALCGGVLGAWSGLTAGMLAAVIYSLGSPFGLPVPLMLGAQALGLGSAGVLGSVVGNRVLVYHFKGRRLAALAGAVIIGLGSTLIYDLLTNLAILGAFDLNARVVLAGAVPFALVHLGSNLIVFGSLFTLLLRRVAGLKRTALVGYTGSGLVLLAVVAAWPVSVRAQSPAPSDTTTTAAVDTAGVVRTAVPATGPAAAHGWRRPLWDPFARTALERLKWHSNRVPVIDGGLGAPAVILGDVGTAWNPLVLRDGIPIGTGHILTDDPWLIPTEGLSVDESGAGADGWGGTGGVLSLRSEDATPDRAVSAYRGAKGKHETYFRSIHLLTPRAAWRAAFEFEESLDIEGYNFSGLPDDEFTDGGTNEFPGHSRVRQSRTRLFRELDRDNRLIVEYTNGRLTKDSLPAYGAEHLELWDDGLAVTMQAGLGGTRLHTSLFLRNRDVIWGDRGDDVTVGEGSRKLETGREGVSLELVLPGAGQGPRSGLTVQATSWFVDDSLTDEAWLEGFGGDGNGEGQTVRGDFHVGRKLGGTVWRVAVGADWQSRVGTGPEASLCGAAAGERPWWTAKAEYGGRAPRSDELLTPLARDVAGRRLVLLPNGDLNREKTARLGLLLQLRTLGLDLALDGSASTLRDGILWRELPGEDEQGRWQNGLEMNSSRLTGSIGHEGRFLGWGRVLLEGTWQHSNETAGRAAVLPPERYLRSQIRWENHFFQEDGILEVALYSTVQGEMADPWDVTRTAGLPARTVHDLLVGFRLLGADLSLAYGNLTGERTRLTSGALSSGQELDFRLHWAWTY